MGGVFVYSNPAVIRWGEGSIEHLPAELERLGIERPALISTRSLLENGEVKARLAEILAPSQPVTTAVISQHAPVADIERALRAVQEAAADGLVSLGGGSPIDAAKVVSIRVGDAGAERRRLPHVAIPTTLSVAELASGAGITDESGHKVGVRDRRGLPSAVVYDGALALHTPLELWLSTGIRALDHAVESYLSEGQHPFSDVMALEAVRRLFRTLPEAKADPGSPGLRTESQLAAWFWYTLTGPAAAGLSHMMGKQIGARHGIPHGVTSCLLLPHVMRYRAGWQAERLARLAEVTGRGAGPLAAADDVQALIGSLGLPQHISEFGIGEPELRTAATALAGEHPAPDLLGIYMAAL